MCTHTCLSIEITVILKTLRKNMDFLSVFPGRKMKFKSKFSCKYRNLNPAALSLPEPAATSALLSVGGS